MILQKLNAMYIMSWDLTTGFHLDILFDKICILLSTGLSVQEPGGLHCCVPLVTSSVWG